MLAKAIGSANQKEEIVRLVIVMSSWLIHLVLAVKMLIGPQKKERQPFGSILWLRGPLRQMAKGFLAFMADSPNTHTSPNVPNRLADWTSPREKRGPLLLLRPVIYRCVFRFGGEGKTETIS